ncbi:MAG: PfaD family polyunsaturated fatty acid/polyketide biosynthesis protein [Desulfobacterales bacterium]|nr:PfaD family polyunsaturated fatty acid/polyketide biosynthesis protein [Desulfobacterales bacterium]MDX2512356.1 PfaD family polyunsaturated fatty acid/polyketide biosynthesis protein [Desulfobacterales bacterium]
MHQANQLGWWIQGEDRPGIGHDAVNSALKQVEKPIYVIDAEGQIGVTRGGGVVSAGLPPHNPAYQEKKFPWIAFVPPLHPSSMGSPDFMRTYGLRYPYVVGAMANGITSVKMVEAAGRAGMLGFYGAAGLAIPQIETAIHHLQATMGGLPFGFNLIHSPGDPNLELETVHLYLRHGVRLISASAFMNLTLSLVYYRIKGIQKDENGITSSPQKIIAKISREEVAKKFLAPPPEKFIRQLLDLDWITSQEALLAETIPMADALTAEADSGGHTDNRPALALLPTMISLRDRARTQFNFETPLSIGLGGGIATPESAAAAFAMGADYIVTGSINQACVEAGTSDTVRQMLSEARQADITMAPAADMFEMGVKVQVLKRGTMFPLRAGKLYELYTSHDTYEDIPGSQRKILEKDFFRRSFYEEWAHTRNFFLDRDPVQIEKAEKNPKHKMALVFRSYLGQSSNWANTGEASRKIDYQIWCGPAIGAFNQWVKDSFLESAHNRQVVVIALNILLGAAIVTRRQWLRQQGIFLPDSPTRIEPLELEAIQELIGKT